MFSDLLLCAGRFKKQDRKTSWDKESLARLGGLEDISGGGDGVRKKQNLWVLRKKKQKFKGGTKILVGMKKNYFLSMLPLVGDTYGEAEQSVGERRGFLTCKTSSICR